ncbi:hypothetical protein AWZ03_000198 [Drosophila navojoa]|uniref:PH domain-containing protein n=1 Tax=Drosophila navojoa TaxID=7232 RepID=A0A484BXF7_DRONA|nr:oxysterol-binding protein-related protein 11 [Drosophila navojoa]TDG53383.1 hypothetical protein AWZ03_000198 [Drosophila navojoa]
MESNLNRMINQTLRHPLSGQLSKYTNVMKGWQYRWFTVDAKTGYLSYYLCDSSAVGDDIAPSPHVLANTPRGQVQLAGAVVYPSDEDSRTFSIACASGDTVKLRASDARARQEWVDGLRAVVESHTQAMDISNSSPLPARELLAASDAMVAARQALFLTEQCNASLARAIENIDCASFSPTDPDLLLLKAISTASTQCLHQCLGLLQRHQEINQPPLEEVTPPSISLALQ